MSDFVTHEIEDPKGEVQRYIGEGKEKAAMATARSRKGKLTKKVYQLESEQVIEDFRPQAQESK